MWGRSGGGDASPPPGQIALCVFFAHVRGEATDHLKRAQLLCFVVALCAMKVRMKIPTQIYRCSGSILRCKDGVTGSCDLLVGESRLV